MSLSRQKGIVYRAQVEWLVLARITDRMQRILPSPLRGRPVGEVMSWELMNIYEVWIFSLKAVVRPLAKSEAQGGVIGGFF